MSGTSAEDAWALTVVVLLRVGLGRADDKPGDKADNEHDIICRREWAGMRDQRGTSSDMALSKDNHVPQTRRSIPPERGEARR
jgi:hypothetical protein